MTELTVYAIRLAPRAERDIAAASAGLALLAGTGAAEQWEQGLFEAIRTLATLPGRLPLALEDNVLNYADSVRQLVYRRRRGGTAYRVLFRVDEGGAEGPTVFVLHVRHAAKPAATAEELQQDA